MKRWGDARGAVLAVCGLAAEARIAAGPGVLAIAGGGDAAGLAAAIEEEIGRGARLLLSFGVAGALAPRLQPGALIVPSAVIDGAGGRYQTDARRSATLREMLAGSLDGVLFGSDGIIGTAADKARLHGETGADAVDMESLIAARAAAAHSLGFIAIRAVADEAETSLPPAASIAMRPGGGIDLGAVLASLWRQPSQLPALLALARDSRAALGALGHGRRLLGRRLGDLDLDELLVDVV